MGSDRDIIRSLGTVGTAFFGSFRELREIQRRAVPPIRSGRNVLVASATASGKTEAILAPLVARTLDEVRGDAPRVRVLLIAPTRALVNDLMARIEGPLDRLGVACGRQTSDHRDKGKAPFVLVTTPESFDSMLVRDAQLQAGKVVDHLLAGVAAVFVDEAHLFDGTARGDQVSWLLGRLRRLRQLHVEQGTGDGSHVPQLCAGSATISDPEGLACRLLGPEAEVVRVEGNSGSRGVWASGFSRVVSARSINDDRKPCVNGWTLYRPLDSAKLQGGRIWQALSNDSGFMRKALVFAPTRRLCDTFSAHLSCVLPRRRELEVFAHHGSLSRNRRERAESGFASARDAVLVATTTLEVGVDIGDVDLVALIGAPPGTRSLLQRIGRAGRRIGRTRVLVLPRTEIEQAALASMLLSARDGVLEPKEYGRRWSVFVQQTASFVAQGRPRGRRCSDLLELAGDVWPEEPAVTADAIVENLLNTDCLVEHRGRLAIGESWADAFDVGGRGMHANFDYSGGGIPVVDASTGETVAHVAQRPPKDRDLALGGQRWDVQEGTGGEILLKPKGDGTVREGFQYMARSAPTEAEFAVHVRRGLGLDESDAPLFDSSDGLMWLHFGGSVYQTLLCALLPDLRPIDGLAGLAVAGIRALNPAGNLHMQETEVRETVDRFFSDLERILAVGPYQQDLPNHIRRQVVADLVDVPSVSALAADPKCMANDEQRSPADTGGGSAVCAHWHQLLVVEHVVLGPVSVLPEQMPVVGAQRPRQSSQQVQVVHPVEEPAEPGVGHGQGGGVGFADMFDRLRALGHRGVFRPVEVLPTARLCR